MRKKRVGLEHHVDRPPVRRHAGDVLALQQEAALAWCFEAGEHPEKRGLAATGRPEQREELSLVDIEAQVVDGDEIAEPLRNVLELDERFRRRIIPRRERAFYRSGCLGRHEIPPILPKR